MKGRYCVPDGPKFWAKVSKTDTCWNWIGGKDRDGYGQFCPSGSTIQRAHRYSYKTLVGPIADGMTIDHLCKNRACVNPDHMEVVTLKENILRGFSPAAQHARATHCKNGHELPVPNSRGKRTCKICYNAWHRDWVAKYGRKKIA
jgi:hypothetical protein